MSSCKFALVVLMMSFSLGGCDRIAGALEKRKAIKLCEGKLLPSLYAPSTYQLVSSEFAQTGPYTKDAFRASIQEHVAAQERRFEQLDELKRIYLTYNKMLLRDTDEFDRTYEAATRGKPITKSYVVLIYDAQELAGATPRAAYMCQIINGDDGQPKRVFSDGPVDRFVAEKQ